jgi:hypothetical protein
LQPTTPSSRLEAAHPSTYQSPYVPAGPIPKLAVIVRLRMLQDDLLRIRLEQAKLTVAALELQAAGSKSRLELAVKLWPESLPEQPSALPTSPSSALPWPRPPAAPPSYPPSIFQIRLAPAQTYLLPRTTVAMAHEARQGASAA